MFSPYGHHVLIEREAEEEASETFELTGESFTGFDVVHDVKIIRPEMSKDVSSKCVGFVRAKGAEVPDEVQVGAKVLFRKYAAEQSPKIDGMDNHYLMTDGDLLGAWE